MKNLDKSSALEKSNDFSVQANCRFAKIEVKSIDLYMYDLYKGDTYLGSISIEGDCGGDFVWYLSCSDGSSVVLSAEEVASIYGILRGLNKD